MRLFKDQFGEDEFDLTVEKAAERTGRRIRTIRMARGLSQGELGAKVGLTADRIQKYENGARKPKLDLLRQIALALDVSVYALMDPTTSSYVNSMYTLFEMERDYGLELNKIDGKVYITFDRHAGLYSHIEEWYLFYRLTQEKLQSAISTEEKSQLLAEYYDWEWNFPKGLIAETSKGMKKAAIKSRIEDLQDELKKLEEEGM